MSDSASRILQGRIMPGDRLGHFELVEYVGGGGMGRVFRAVDTRLNRTVALKVLSVDQAADEETRLRFQNEARSAARLDHENIARVHYVGEDRGLHYIVFEFIEGVNIRAMVERKGRLPLTEAVSYTLQVAEALAHAASRDVVHRDIKPSNVLIMPDGHVKVIDMGLARLRRIAAEADLTASGVTLGTFDYISPEQARDPRDADVRSDIYSLGCTFFYMLAGRPPFPEGTVLQKLLQHQGDRPPDVREFRPELPDEVDRVLRKMLAKDPRHRYRAPNELVEDLFSLAEQVGLRPLGQGKRVLVAPHAAKMSPLQRHLPWILPITALVCIVSALHIFWSSSPVPGPGPPAAGRETPEDPGSHAPALPVVEGGGAEPAPADRSGGPTKVPQPRRPAQEAVEAATPSATGPHTGAITGAGAEHGPADVAVAASFGPRTAGGSPGAEITLGPLEGGLSAGETASYGLGVEGSAGDSPGVLTGAAEIAPADPAVRRSGLLVVDGDAEAEGSYRTLNAACSAAVNGDVIELRYDGRRNEQPIKLVNMKVTIRAGEGYHPVVVFQPDDVDPFKYARSMLTLTAGRLTLIGVALELHVPRAVPADNWSLVEIKDGQAVKLERCSLTICNASGQRTAYHSEVVFFQVESALGADLAIGDNLSAIVSPTSIGLVDCIARGEADFLHCDDLQPINLSWENGLLVTTGCLLSTGGGQQSPEPRATTHVDLRHVSAVIGGGLCRLSADYSSPYQLPLEINCSDSILMGGDGAALVEQAGIDEVDEFRTRLAWLGDRNFYENFDVFWEIRGTDRQPLVEPMDFDGWQTYWGSEDENLPLRNAVKWRNLPEVTRPLHAHAPTDYALDDSGTDNPAIGAASDGRNAGLQVERLPELPPPATQDTPGPEPSK